MYNEFDIVELTHDIVGDKLKESESGTIVDIYRNGKAYEVEFVNPDGTTKALLTLMLEDIRPYIEHKNVFSSFSAPISLGTVSGMTFTVSEENRWRGLDKTINIGELDIKTESKENMKKFQFARL